MGGVLPGTAPAAPTPTPSFDDYESLVVASGTLLPERRANLAFRISGQAVQVAVKAGDAVKQGDVLVRLEAGELEAAVAQAAAGRGGGPGRPGRAEGRRRAARTSPSPRRRWTRPRRSWPG